MSIRSVPIDSGLFVENRRRLASRLDQNSLAVVNANDIMPTNADGVMGFHQNADLFYLTGISQEESILLLAPDAFDEKLREVLFLREPSEYLRIWEGHKLSREQARRISGVEQIKWIADFPTVFHQLMCECDHVYLNSNEHVRASSEVETRDARFIRDCQRRYPLHDYRRLARELSDMRLQKSETEIQLIKQACAITETGFRRVLQFVRPDVNEAEIEAEFAHEFIRNKAFFAYPPIVAAGENNCVLHYTQNDQPCQTGQLVLLDVGAGYGHYMSDLTRTIPVNGRFTQRQRQVYDAVLRVLRAVSQAMQPGTLVRDLKKQSEQLIERECVGLGLLTEKQIEDQDPDKPAVRKYFMHGVGHSMGLDVHDVGLASRPLAPGWVLTCEPGIYIQEEGFGIRLENDILVAESGPVDLMAGIPIEADEIERLMAESRGE